MSQTPEHAARLSFLIAISAIARAAKIKLWNLQQTTIKPYWFMLGIATTVTEISASFCIAILLKIEKKQGACYFSSTGSALAG